MSKLVLISGWIGATLLAFCGLPEVYFAITSGTTALSWPFLLAWGTGEVLALVYVIGKTKEVDLLPLLFNYGVNIICISILIYFKF